MSHDEGDIVDAALVLGIERFDEMDTLSDEEKNLAKPHAPPVALDFPVISVGKWPEGLSLRREDLYGDDGR